MPEPKTEGFQIDAYGTPEQWAFWEEADAAFCLECIDGQYSISIRTKGTDGEITLHPAEMSAAGQLQTVPGAAELKAVGAKWRKVEVISGSPPSIEHPFIIAFLIRAISNELPFYVRKEESLAALLALLARIKLTADAESYPGTVIADHLQTGAPDWDESDLPCPHRPSPSLTLVEVSNLPAPLKDQTYVVHTSQEFNELMAAAADGHSGRNYVDDPQAGTRTHARKGSAFVTRLALLPDEHATGGVDLLNNFTKQQNADSSMMLLYISHLLAPPAPLPRGAYAGGWVDLNDVARKVGLNMRLAKDAEQARQQVWNLILFGARANVIGARSIAYQAADGSVIPTRIETPPWAIMGKERPIQPELFGAEVPMRVELVMSREWTTLTARPETAQYLPFGEVLGSIPPGRPGGAWARVVGLAFLGFCRRNPKKVLAGTLQATRRELLDEFQPAVSPYQDLPTDQPSRVVEYWYSAIHILVERGLVAAEGEAAIDFVKWKRSKQNRAYGWLDAWLNEKVDLRPGEALQKAMEDRADRLPTGAGKRKPKRRH